MNFDCKIRTRHIYKIEKCSYMQKARNVLTIPTGLPSSTWVLGALLPTCPCPLTWSSDYTMVGYYCSTLWINRLRFREVPWLYRGHTALEKEGRQDSGLSPWQDFNDQTLLKDWEQREMEVCHTTPLAEYSYFPVNSNLPPQYTHM